MAAAEVGGQQAMRPEIDERLRRLQHPARRRGPRCRCSPRTTAREYTAEVRARALDVLEAAALPRSRAPLTEDGLRLRHGRPARTAARRDHAATHQLRRGPAVLTAPDPPAPMPAVHRRRRSTRPGGPFTMGTSHRAVGPGQRTSGAPRRGGGLRSGHRARDERRLSARSSRTAATTDPRWWHPDGWAQVQRANLERTAVLAARRRQLAAPQVRCTPSSFRRGSRCCTCAGTRRTRTPAGRAAGCRPRPSGRRPPGTTRRPARSRALPVGRRRTRRPSTPTSASAICGPPPPGRIRRARRRCGARQLIGDVWEWTSSDFLPYPGFAAFPYREYSEVFFGPEYKVLRGGSFARRTRWPAGARSATGTYPIRRQIFAGFRTADARPDGGGADVPSPRLPRAARRRSADVVTRPPHALFRQSWAPRRQRHGTVNADGFGIGWYAERRSGVPARYRRAGPIWADPSFADLARVVRSTRAARGRARRHRGGRSTDEAAAAPFADGPLAVQPQRRGAPAGRVARRPSARPLPARGPARAGGALRLRAALGAGPAPAARRGAGRRAAWRDSCRRGRGAAPGSRLNLLLTDGATIAATAWGDTLWYLHRAGRRECVVASEPVRRRSATGPRCRTAPWSRARTTSCSRPLGRTVHAGPAARRSPIA